MKDEEFNNFFRERAEQFEMQPSSGSFGSVMGKMRKKRKKILVWICLPLLLVSAVAGSFFIQSGAESMPEAATQNTTGTQSPIVLNQDKNSLENTIHNETANKQVQPHGEQKPATLITNAPHSINLEEVEPVATNTIVDLDAASDNLENETKLPLLSLAGKRPSLPILVNAVGVSIAAIEPNKREPIIRGRNNNDDFCDEKNTLQFSYSYFNIQGSSGSKEQEFINKTQTILKTIGNGQGPTPAPFALPPGSTLQVGEVSWGNGLSINAGYRRKVSKHWAIQSGISYSIWNNQNLHNEYEEHWDSTSSERFNPMTNLFETQIEVKSSWEKTSSYQYTTRIHALRVPVSIAYKFNKSCRWGWEISGGFSVDYLLKTQNKVTILSGNPTILEQNNGWGNYQRLNVSALVGISANYYVTKKVGVFGGLRLEKTLQPVYKAGTGNVYGWPNLWGFEAGVRIKF